MFDRSPVRPRFLFLATLTLLASTVALPAADQKRVVVGKYVSPTGRLSVRAPGQKWEIVKQNAPVYSGDMLLGLPGSAIDSKDGAVRLVMLADLRRLSPYPILEPAAVIHATDKYDLDFTIDRGRMVIRNQKKEGSATVRLHFRDDVWTLTLKEPGTLVGVELYGRWPRGIYWHPGDNPPEVPTSKLTVIVLEGEVQLQHHKHSHLMRPPPGPALIQWDSIVGDDPSPTRLETLPPWADRNQPYSQRAKRIRGLINFFAERQATVGGEKAIEEALHSKDPAFQRMGVISLGAMDALPELIDYLGSSRSGDLRDEVILVLRHWIGRGPGQDAKLYQALLKKKYTPVQAKTILYLLHSFDATALARPETFSTLIAYLNHDNLAVRELAEYHLYRLVPAGKDIVYNPAGTPAEREAAVKKWKALIPEGQMPPRPKDEKKPKDLDRPKE